MSVEQLPRSVPFRDAGPVRPPVPGSCPSCVMLAARLVEANDSRDTLAALTPREREVLQCVSRGLTNRQIARTLGIVEKTVKNHLYAIFAKIRVSDRTQAALFAISAAAAG